MAVKTFLPVFFNEEGSIDMAECSSEVYTKMREFWDFFDTDLDGIVSRIDVEKGKLHYLVICSKKLLDNLILLCNIQYSLQVIKCQGLLFHHLLFLALIIASCSVLS